MYYVSVMYLVSVKDCVSVLDVASPLRCHGGGVCDLCYVLVSVKDYGVGVLDVAGSSRCGVCDLCYVLVSVKD